MVKHKTPNKNNQDICNNQEIRHKPSRYSTHISTNHHFPNFWDLTHSRAPVSIHRIAIPSPCIHRSHETPCVRHGAWQWCYQAAWTESLRKPGVFGPWISNHQPPRKRSTLECSQQKVLMCWCHASSSKSGPLVTFLLFWAHQWVISWNLGPNDWGGVWQLPNVLGWAETGDHFIKHGPLLATIICWWLENLSADG